MHTHVHPATCPGEGGKTEKEVKGLTEADHVHITADATCFVCAKPFETTDDASPTEAMQALPCTCLVHARVHVACFDEWYSKEGTCPYCRAPGPDVDAIREQVRRSGAGADVTTSSEDDEDDATHRRNARLMGYAVFGLCGLLCIAAIALICTGDLHLHTDDDAHTHAYAYDDDGTPAIWTV